MEGHDSLWIQQNLQRGVLYDFEDPAPSLQGFRSYGYVLFARNIYELQNQLGALLGRMVVYFFRVRDGVLFTDKTVNII